MEPNQTPTQIPTPRNFVIPGADVVIQCGDSSMPVEQLLGIVFQLAASNPDARVDFWIKIRGEG
jgi:hypothetical protein